MKIDCLMGTYGRHALASEALACFLQQSAISQATLLIYNQHPVALNFEHPRVRIVNEAPPTGSLRFIRRRMLDLADPLADLIHFWDDDDLYLPWHLEDCLQHINTSVAWKPTSCWMSEQNVTFSRHKNTFEGSWVFRADYLRVAPLHTHPTYTDHPVFRQTVEAGLLTTTELGAATSYIYRWANGGEHLSAIGQVGETQGGKTEDVQRRDIRVWRSRSNDVRAGGRLVPTDLAPRWLAYLDGIRASVSYEEWERNREWLDP